MHEINPKDICPTDLVLDVRTVAEHDKMALTMPHWHVDIAHLNPIKFIKEHGLDGSKTLYILCRHGGRGMTAAEKFIRVGFTNVAVIKGGILNAQKEGMQILYSHSISMERQVRIMAGSIVLTGILLGLFSPWFYLISALMGLSLIIGGIRGRCPLVYILSEMPWNQ
ncbi:MAG: rhodanese-like domain-containing protein [Alphaproteobacteria bacterium]|nr:rhodanese-like domain-containing protein [Alphaproteobacteria bacterium]